MSPKRHWSGSLNFFIRCDGKQCWREGDGWVIYTNRWEQRDSPIRKSFYLSHKHALDAADELQPIVECKCTPAQVLEWEIQEATKT